MKLKVSEHQIQTLLMNYLQANRWYVLRLNSGKYAVGEGSNRRMVIGQEAGTPDLMCFKYSKDQANTDLVFIEVKVPGNKPTEVQVRKMKELEAHGARTMVVHSLEELQEKL